MGQPLLPECAVLEVAHHGVELRHTVRHGRTRGKNRTLAPGHLRERLSSVFVNFFFILSDYIYNEYIGVTFLPTDITTKSYVL